MANKIRFTIPAFAARKLVDAAIEFAELDGTRQALAAIKMESVDGKLRMVSVDGFKLQQIDTDIDVDGDLDILADAKSLKQAIKSLLKGLRPADVKVVNLTFACDGDGALKISIYDELKQGMEFVDLVRAVFPDYPPMFEWGKDKTPIHHARVRADLLHQITKAAVTLNASAFKMTMSSDDVNPVRMDYSGTIKPYKRGADDDWFVNVTAAALLLPLPLRGA